MTLYAQPFVTGAAQIVFKHGAVTGIMAGDTGHRLTITWIVGIVTGRVAEVVMPFMTTNAGLISPPFEHGWFCRTVELMTIEAAFGVRVEVATVFAAFKFTGMAIATGFTGVAANQPCLLTGVGGVTIKAE